MTRIYVATTKTMQNLIVKQGQQKHKWVQKLRAWALKHGELADKDHFPVNTFFDETTVPGIQFKEDPGRDWRKFTVKVKGVNTTLYTPSRATKVGRELDKEFKELKQFNFKKVNEKLNLGLHFKMGTMSGPQYFYELDGKYAGVSLHKDHPWEVPRGFKEITWGEYKKLAGE